MNFCFVLLFFNSKELSYGSLNGLVHRFNLRYFSPFAVEQTVMVAQGPEAPVPQPRADRLAACCQCLSVTQIWFRSETSCGFFCS